MQDANTVAKVDIIEEVYETFKGIKQIMDVKYPERVWMAEMPLMYLERSYQGLKQNKPMLWYFFVLPQEMFCAWDIALFSPEVCTGIWASLGQSALSRICHYFDVAGAHITDALCAVNKFPVGLLLSGDSKRPDMMIYGASDPCDSAKGVYSNLNFCLDIPSFYIDTPYLSNERGYKYVGKQLREMISFIEEHTKQRLDWDKFREAIGYANQAWELVNKIHGLGKSVPTSLKGREIYTYTSAMVGLAGTPEVVPWLNKRYEVTKERAQRGEAVIQDEKHRLLWVANHIDMDIGLFDWLEEKHDAVVVASMLGLFPFKTINISGSETSILEGLAQRVMDYPISRIGRVPIELFIDDIIEHAKDFKADAVIFTGNIGCKYYWTSTQLIKDKIYDVLGIPTLVIELSPWDPRVASPEHIRAQFDQFFELMM